MITVGIAVLIASSCNNETNSSEKPESAATATIADKPVKDTASFHAVDTTKLAKGEMYYQCSMHPEVITDKPGDCPKCGMKLVMKHKSN